MNAPLNTWNRGQQRMAVVLATAGTTAFAMATARFYGPFLQQSDANWYLAIARGQTGSVMQPFAARQLHALTVRGIAAVFHQPVEWTFVAVGLFCLIFLLAVVFSLMMQTAAPRWMLLAVGGTLVWPILYAGLALPDLWYGAWTAVLLLLLSRRRYLAAAWIMLPLMVSRESTVLAAICFVIAAWRELRWRGLAIAGGACALGMLVVHQLVSGGRGNAEGLPQAVYMLGKAPWNLARNVLGVQPWSNLYPMLCNHPRWQWAVHLGPVQAVGVCHVDPIQPILWIQALLTVFGLLPALAVALWLRQRGRRAEQRDVLLRFCVIYGVTYFVLSPALGTAVARMVGYAWPLLVVAVPMLARRMRGGWRVPAFLAIHLSLCLVGLHLHQVISQIEVRWTEVTLLAAFAAGCALAPGMMDGDEPGERLSDPLYVR